MPHPKLYRAAWATMKLSSISLVMSVGSFIGIGVAKALTAVDGMIAYSPILTISALFVVVSLWGMGCALILFWLHRRNVRRRQFAQRSITIPLEPMEKQPGWNRAVLGYFHRGSELRTRDEEFKKAFAMRAQVPPPRRKS